MKTRILESILSHNQEVIAIGEESKKKN